jgi:hypothetical protein
MIEMVKEVRYNKKIIEDLYAFEEDDLDRGIDHDEIFWNYLN